MLKYIRDSLSHYQVPNVEIDFKIVIDGKSFFDLPVKNEEEAYEKIRRDEMNRNKDCTTCNLLGFAYFNENYKLIAIDLSKQLNEETLSKLILVVNLKNKITEQQCFFSLKNQKKLLLSFSKILSISFKNGNRKDCKFVKQF